MENPSHSALRVYNLYYCDVTAEQEYPATDSFLIRDANDLRASCQAGLSILSSTREDDLRQNSAATLPVSEDLILAMAGSVNDYLSVWNNRAGSASSLQEPSRFYFQTPQDGGSFCSFAVRSVESEDSSKSFRCISISTDLDISAMFKDIGHLPSVWKSTDLPMIVVPLAFLKHHVQRTSAELLTLISHVEEVEGMVVARSEDINFERLIKILHSCNTRLVKLQRRWHFETELASLLKEFVDNFEKPKPNSTQINVSGLNMGTDSHCYILNNGLSTGANASFSGVREGKDFRTLESNVVLQMRLSMASEYDLSVLPRRIQNQFTTVFNLVAQRDSKATIELAQNSGQIAEATMKDSSAMRTIAVMTLIFLPATFLSSFFSMTFFSWDSNETYRHSLWIYFAAAVPLTFVVIMVWLCLMKRSSRIKLGSAKAAEKLV